VARAGDPDVSVVVPAHNAEATIPKLFAALDRTTFDGEWELIVVDDASTDATPDLARDHGAKVVRLEGQAGPAGSRNAGLAAASAPLIAFTDADCEPAPEWLAAMVRALGQADLVTGPVRPTPDVPRGPFDRTLHIPSQSPLFETANLAVRREVVDQVGGFEPFAPPGDGTLVGLRPSVDQGHFGEDAVFGWRAQRQGARVAFAEDALVHHAVFPRDAWGYAAERWRLRYFPALVREVPELRSRLFARYFLARNTALFDLAALGIVAAAATRRPWPLVAVLPYLAKRLSWRGGGPVRVLRKNAAFVAGDAVGFVALVRGSIAARRILL
jgi:glycosyltransferase involved in cell wall biosynthesis